MSQYRFSNAQKFAVWKHHGQACFWCGEPLRLQEAEVDHVLPESLETKPTELAKALTHLGLPATFKINGYENWLPVHTRCNRSKSDHVFKLTPMIGALLEKLIREAAEVEATVDKVVSNAKVDRALGEILSAVENGALDRAKILLALSEPELEADENAQVLGAELRTHIDTGRWQVIATLGNVATVSDGRFGGVTPTGDKPSETWRCPHCGSFGPWNGSICLNCNQRDDLDY